MKPIILAATLAATLAGCASTPATPTNTPKALSAKVANDIRVLLREPSSGQFQNFRSYKIANGETGVCVEVNSRNGFGGMTGFQDMVVFYQPGGQHIVFDGEPALFECNGLRNGTSSRF